MTNQARLIPFSSEHKPNVSIVGGKAASLIRLTQAGLNVPDGFVLPVDFFTDWVRTLSSSQQWQHLCNTNPADLNDFTQSCERLKEVASNLNYTSHQLESVQQAASCLPGNLYAVRSSSPEEDLTDSSFAGLYETRLNTSDTQLADAIQFCFLSCLDARVFIYKHKQNLPMTFPRIAVVVQLQVNSEVSGVLFSLNPLNNDYDEAVINATFGLGEALVSGEITPDSWTVNKTTNEVINFTLGTKGGTQSETACLSTQEIEQLVAAALTIEQLYSEPVDIEWAYAQGKLFLLQARPITTYIPLPPEMMTAPGEPRILYMDESLADGITISGPVTQLSNDFVMYLIDKLFRFVDPNMSIYQEAKTGLMYCSGVRLYMNISVLMSWVNPSLLEPAKRPIDTTYADIIATCDFTPYEPQHKSSIWQRMKLLPFLFKFIWQLRVFLFAMLKAMFRLSSFQEKYEQELISFDAFLRLPVPSMLFTDLLMHYYIPMIDVTQRTTGPALTLYVYRGTEFLKKIIDEKSNRQAELSEAILSGSDDIVMEMGMLLYEMSTLLPAAEFNDLDNMSQQILDRTIDPEFLRAWDHFQHRFGCRGPLEMDLARPKYSEEPMLVLMQLSTIAKGGQKFDPRVNHQKLKENRHQAYEELLKILPKRKQKKLATAYTNICALERSREIPKDHIVTIQKRIREYLLDQAKTWVREDRLNSVEQIFELTVMELDQAQRQPAFDLLATLDSRDPYFERARRVRHFPHAIDSRGRILRPKTENVPGQLVGVPVSSGIATGPVKVLNDPFEKDVEEGDILVAHTTDPGWTPLFINAAAVLLEVGGELQHGALVAREYGKPCIAGIVNVTRSLEDGQLVEVDGNSGRVTLLPAES